MLCVRVALRTLLATVCGAAIAIGHDGRCRAAEAVAAPPPSGGQILHGLASAVFGEAAGGGAGGLALLAATWALTLASRYYRQVRLQENATWRRHLLVDALLLALLLLAFYPAALTVLARCLVAPAAPLCTHAKGSLAAPPCGPPEAAAGDSSKSRHFDLNHSLSMEKEPPGEEERTRVWGGALLPVSGRIFLAVLAVAILVEENIRSACEPAKVYFKFHPSNGASISDVRIRRAKRIWTAAAFVSLAVAALFLAVFLSSVLPPSRSRQNPYRMRDKLFPALAAAFAWLFLIAIRFVTR